MAQFTALPEQLLMRPVILAEVYIVIVNCLLKTAIGERASVAILKIVCTFSFSLWLMPRFLLYFIMGLNFQKSLAGA